MSTDDAHLIPFFIPSLVSILIASENKKGTPLTLEEVLDIRDKSSCTMIPPDIAKQIEEKREYPDLDPENCWYEWQMLRRSLGRKPDLDPGPKWNRISSSAPAYLRTIQDAQSTLNTFRGMLPTDGSPRFGAMLKIKVFQNDDSFLMWLNNVRRTSNGFIAEFFELPTTFSKYQMDDEIVIASEDVLDWMVNENGLLHGGYSIRFHRSTLLESERDEYDKYIGVSVYSEQ